MHDKSCSNISKQFLSLFLFLSPLIQSKHSLNITKSKELNTKVFLFCRWCYWNWYHCYCCRTYSWWDRCSFGSKKLITSCSTAIIFLLLHSFWLSSSFFLERIIAGAGTVAFLPVHLFL